METEKQETHKELTFFEKLRKINVNENTKNKNGMTYLPWAYAWDEFKKICPDATYEILKNVDGLPFFENKCGVMVFTKITGNGQTYEMWLPVLNSANDPMKAEPYSYTITRKNKYTGKLETIEKHVDAFTMFDVNTAIMRCFVKNIAMFGLGLYIYSGEDLPADENDGPKTVKSKKRAPDFDGPQPTEVLMKIEQTNSMDQLIYVYDQYLKTHNFDQENFKELEAHFKDKAEHFKDYVTKQITESKTVDHLKAVYREYIKGVYFNQNTLDYLIKCATEQSVEIKNKTEEQSC